MSRAILIHGCCNREEYFSNEFPSPSNSHWFPWLQKQLLIQGIFTQTPEFPIPYQPDFHQWKISLILFSIDENTILIGHSCGGGFILRYLMENNLLCKRIILIALWLDPQKTKSDFLQFNLSEISLKIKQLDIFISEDEDVEGVKESVEKISAFFSSAKIHQFKDKGHFTFHDMKTTEFPELLELLSL
jgi:predicted alpha/beta hydrolase family esterase